MYDPETGWVIIGGGYNRRDLTDMWAYDASEGSLATSERVTCPSDITLPRISPPRTVCFVLATSTQKAGDRTTCNVLFPVRTTYAYRIDPKTIVEPGEPLPNKALPKLEPEKSDAGQIIDLNAYPEIAGY